MAVNIRDQIVIHLYRIGKKGNDLKMPFESTELGIMCRVGVKPEELDATLGYLLYRGFIRKLIADVQNESDAVCYKITPLGMYRAEQILKEQEVM